MLRCLAIDDEPLALELLEDNISKVPFLQLVGACAHPLEAMQVLQHEPVDLIFLDIQMPGLTGLQFIQSLAIKPMFILITAYEKYALDGYTLDVVDYLVKPVSLERFIKASHKALHLHQLKNNQASPQKELLPEYLFVNVEYSLVKLVIAQIMWIEGLKDYIKIHLQGNKPVITRMNMKTIEDQLPPARFLRIHKSYIVSVNYITAVRKSSVFINDIELPVGENYRDAIAQLTGRQGL